MTFESVVWQDDRKPSDLAALLQTSGADSLRVERNPGEIPSQVIARVVQSSSGADVVVVFDPAGPAGSLRRQQDLPPLVRLLAVLPDVDASVVIPSRSLLSQPEVVRQSNSLCELAVRLAETGSVAFEETLPAPDARFRLPQLTMPAGGPRHPWLRDILAKVRWPGASPTGLTALRAGLFLLNDFFAESHECSQSIEGRGPHHTGDYWHAILHRREPDYGNSRYWFRHVGQHPVFADLAHSVAGMPPVPQSARVLPHAEWDPFAFVDLCAAAERDPELKAWCEQVQFREMLLLLSKGDKEERIGKGQPG